MTVFGFASGEYQYMDSSAFVHWSDRDDFPVSARNYAHEIFRYDEDLEETADNITDELNDWFGEGAWAQVSPGVFEAIETTTSWPFIVRRRIEVVVKFHSFLNGWQELPYDHTKHAGPMVPIGVYQDCD